MEVIARANYSMLRETYIELSGKYTDNVLLSEGLWGEIASGYSEKHRHYHTRTHLENLLKELQQIKPLIADWDTVLFTLFYHDVVYNPARSDNEEKSAEIAAEHMRQMGIDADRIAKCCLQIMATKAHSAATDADTNYFTDADLSVLGAAPEAYAAYALKVRKEYSIYPDLLYKPGRKKVLRHFLAMERIYKTTHFYDRYETAARHNLQRELDGVL
jgi:predicted metal-dependent HD superfamily phosphohydrolase